MALFPANVEAMTPALLSRVFSESTGQTVAITDVAILEHDQCGDGVASTADRVRLQVSYADGQSAGLPEQMTLKTIFLHRFLRFGMPMIIGTAKAVNGLERLPLLGRFSAPTVFTLINVYQRFFPHAPEAMYRNEVNFYGRLRRELAIEAPQTHAAVMDERNGQFGIFMEDLSLRSARFPNAVDGVSLNEMQHLIRNLAALHAHFWQSPRLDTDLAWLPKTFEGGMFPVFDAIGLNIIKDQVTKNPFKQRRIAPLGRSVDELWDANWQAQRLIYREPPTVLHGDTHIGNTYVLPDGRGGLLDWQLIVRGPWCHDLAYLMMTGLDVGTRRQHEADLLRLYRDSLAEHGVTRVPDADEAFLRYRQSTVWGLVIGWLITPPQNYGETITDANIAKIVTAMQDLDTLGALVE
jgi:hypothetical protein